MRSYPKIQIEYSAFLRYCHADAKAVDPDAPDSERQQASIVICYWWRCSIKEAIVSFGDVNMFWVYDYSGIDMKYVLYDVDLIFFFLQEFDEYIVLGCCGRPFLVGYIGCRGCFGL